VRISTLFFNSARCSAFRADAFPRRQWNLTILDPSLVASISAIASSARRAPPSPLWLDSYEHKQTPEVSNTRSCAQDDLRRAPRTPAALDTSSPRRRRGLITLRPIEAQEDGYARNRGPKDVAALHYSYEQMSAHDRHATTQSTREGGSENRLTFFFLLTATALQSALIAEPRSLRRDRAATEQGIRELLHDAVGFREREHRAALRQSAA